MPRVKTIQTVRSRVEGEANLREMPEFKVGDWVEVYYGQYEGHNFVIKDVRWDYDHPEGYQYLRGDFVDGGAWYHENQLILRKRA